MDYDTASGRSLLQTVDPVLYNLIEKEKWRQIYRLDLSPAEGFTSFPLDEVALTNNFNGMLGNQPNDALVNLCCNRALRTYGLNPDIWGVNVQSYCHATAMADACTRVVPPYGRIMVLNLPCGVPAAPRFDISGTEKIYFAIMPFRINPSTGFIDYEKIEIQVQNFQPHLIVCGGSAHPCDWDYPQFRSIADKNNALLLCDMTHISGLVAAQEAANPFDCCHIVTTTYKSLKGSTAGLIFYRKDQPKGRVLCALADKTPVFPSLQGGLHNHQMGVLAVRLELAMSHKFKDYASQVKANAVALGSSLVSKGYKLVTGGTNDHLVLWDLHPLGLAGNKVKKLCDLCGITVKNAVFDGRSATAPRRILIGTHAMTSRGMAEEDFEQIGEFLHRAVSITLSIQRQHGRKMKDFNKGLCINKDIIEALKNEVDMFSYLHQLRLSRDRD